MPSPAPAETATLLVCCPDRRGIVAALAQLLYGHGANILDADQHTDSEAGIFFQRIRFDLAGAAHRPPFAGDRDRGGRPATAADLAAGLGPDREACRDLRIALRPLPLHQLFGTGWGARLTSCWS